MFQRGNFSGSNPRQTGSCASRQICVAGASGYRWEKEGPIEIDIENGKRRYFLLKLFSARADGGGDDHGAGGAGGGAGGTAGGTPGM